MKTSGFLFSLLALGLSACGTVISITQPPPPPPASPITKVTIGMPLARVQAVLGHLPACRHTPHCWDYVEVQHIPGRPAIEYHHQLHFRQGRLVRIEDRTVTLPHAPPRPVLSHSPAPVAHIGMSMAQVRSLMGEPKHDPKWENAWTYVHRVQPVGDHPALENHRVIHFVQGRVSKIEEYQVPVARS